jgi:hypothetical protein
MGIWLAMLIPIITSGILLMFYKDKCVWWEFLILFSVSPILIVLFSVGGEKSVTNDTEYWGSYVTEARYYEQWDEEVACQHPVYRTEYSTDSKGNTTSTQVYSHDEHFYDVDHHYERWVKYDSEGSSYSISSPEFEKYALKWKSRKFKDMHRDYHSIDGDSYVSKFDNKDENLYAIVKKHTYENRVQASSSVFNFPDVLAEDIASYGIYEYPQGDMYIPSFVGYKIPNYDKGNRVVDIFNARYGGVRQVRLWFIIYKDKPMETAIMQENLWKGGNKNEFVVCFSVDSENKPQWSRSFTWCENDILKSKVDDFIMSQPIIDGVKIADNITKDVKRHFVRKEFSDFSYLSVELPVACYWWTYMITLIVNIGLGIFIVKNDIDELSESRRRRRGSRR